MKVIMTEKQGGGPLYLTRRWIDDLRFNGLFNSMSVISTIKEPRVEKISG